MFLLRPVHDNARFERRVVTIYIIMARRRRRQKFVRFYVPPRALLHFFDVTLSHTRFQTIQKSHANNSAQKSRMTETCGVYRGKFVVAFPLGGISIRDSPRV